MMYKKYTQNIYRYFFFKLETQKFFSLAIL
jgi:hypothetical protein